MKLKINIFTITLTLMAVVSVLLSSCANEVAPTGGPKDETPPKVLKYSPENYSTNFEGKKIEITFDEFFQLNNYKSKLLISPPFRNEPTFTVKGKKLIINLKDDPIPSTTYKIFLGDAIVDYNESNPYPNFSYIFSTGESIDSLTLSGTLKDAYTLKPVDNAYIFLYKDLSDTAFTSHKPYYMTKTDKDGLFKFDCLSDTIYNVYAIVENDNSLTYNLLTEKIAFGDSLVSPHDSLPINLFIFQTEDSLTVDTSFVASKKINKNRLIVSGGANKIYYEDTLTLNFSNIIKEMLTDSVMTIITHDSIIDTTYYKLKYNDTANNAYVICNLIKKANYTLEVKDSAMVDVNDHYNRRFTWKFSITDEDDFGEIILKLVRDSLCSENNYVVQLLNNSNELKAPERQVFIENDTLSLNFSLLTPGKYYMRIINDSDGNGKWTSGNLAKRRQPEKVIITNPTDVKEKFTIEETVILK